MSEKKQTLRDGQQSQFWQHIVEFAEARIKNLEEHLLSLDPGKPDMALTYARLRGELAGMKLIVNYPKIASRNNP